MTSANFSTALNEFSRDTRQSLSWIMEGLEQIPLIRSTQELNAQAELAARTNLLQKIVAEASHCLRCPLHAGRSRVVFAEGSPLAPVFIVVDPPNYAEDQEGKPVIGEARELLQKMLAAIDIRWEDAYIVNVVKCRPPQDRKPEPSEIDVCEDFLQRQMSIVSPRLVLAMGELASQTLLRTEASLSHLRGRWDEYKKIPLLSTWHPATLLAKAELKREAWEDLKKIKNILGGAKWK